MSFEVQVIGLLDDKRYKVCFETQELYDQYKDRGLPDHLGITLKPTQKDKRGLIMWFVSPDTKQSWITNNLSPVKKI